MQDHYISFSDKSKFASKHIDEIAHQVFKVSKLKDTRLFFDLTSFKWIAPESLIFLTSIFMHFNSDGTPFYVKFKKNRFIDQDTSKKDARRLIYIWEIWGIKKALSDGNSLINDYSAHCDVTDEHIKALKKYFDIGKSDGVEEVYQNWKTVTESPFFAYQSYNSYSGYNEQTFESEISECITLTDKGLQELEGKLSRNPFIDQTLNSIILRELFENSLNHGFDEKVKKEFYFGIGFNQAKEFNFDNEFGQGKDYHELLEKNFSSEAIPETINFFKNKQGAFKNESFIELTFIDFGKGIHRTLLNEYNKFITDDDNLLELSMNHHNQHIASKILEYAFHYNSSQNPIDVRFKDDLIPRGLYDLLSIVWRYYGVLIARSGNGKVLYDFSDRTILHPKDAIHFFSSGEYEFLGTMITIYLPERRSSIKSHVIKPITNLRLSTLNANQYIDIIKLFNNIKLEERNFNNHYNLLFRELDKVINSRFIKAHDRILPIDFAGCEFEKEFTKKLLFYLVSTPNIKANTTIIVLNIADEAFIEQLQDEIIRLKSYRKKYTYQPILCLFDSEISSISQKTIWLGITNLNEEKQLNISLLNYIESQSQNGKTINDWLIDGYLPQLIEENTIKPDSADKIYLTSGNYYQNNFLSFLNTFQNETFVHRISKHLVNKLLQKSFSNLKNKIMKAHDSTIALVSVTISSQLLAKSVQKHLEKSFPNNKFELVRLSNYYSFFTELPFLNIKKKQSVILICDVIATGYLLEQVDRMLIDLREANLLGVLCVSDTRHSLNDNKENEVKCKFIRDDKERVVALTNTHIPKYPFKGFFDKIENRKRNLDIERVNPITNGLNLRDKHTYSDNCLFKPDEFLQMLPSVRNLYLKIGFIEHNQSYHTYYFETDRFFQSIEGVTFVDKCLTKIKNKVPDINIGCVIYPIFSGAEFTIENRYKNVFSQYSRGKVDFIAAPRVNTPKGWRFTPMPDFYTEKPYHTIFIIDDGSCSGETILQLLDEVSVFNVKSVIILSVIARIEDFQREFFSKISQIKSSESPIPVSVFFGVHFHIQVYNNNTFEPFLEEEKNLKLLNENPLFPKIAKAHINNRLKALHRVDSNNLSVHEFPNYLPKVRNSEMVDCVEIFKWRNLLGCIQGYKFYKEYFDVFTELNKKYVSKNKIIQLEAIRDLETLGSVILHEPIFIQTIKDMLPDIYELLGRFIHSIIIGNLFLESKEDEEIHHTLEKIQKGSLTYLRFKKAKLYYDWSHFSLACLYVLTNKGNLFTQENKNEVLLSLFDFCNNDSEGTSYLIWMICNQVPSSEKYISSKPNRTRIEGVITKFLKNKKSQIPKFLEYSLGQSLIYFMSNPFTMENYNDFSIASKKIAGILNKELVRGDYHNTLGYRLGGVINGVKLNPFPEIFLSNWIEVRDSLLTIKKYSYAMSSFLSYYDKDSINELLFGSSNYSLDKMIKNIDLYIDNNDNSLSEIVEYLGRLKSTFEKGGSLAYVLLANDICDLLDVWEGSLEEFKTETHIDLNFQITNEDSLDFNVPIHEKILRDCFSELIHNISVHADLDSVKINISNYFDKIEWEIFSQKKENEKSNSNNKESGLETIEQLLSFYNGTTEKKYDNNSVHFFFKITLLK